MPRLEDSPRTLFPSLISPPSSLPRERQREIRPPQLLSSRPEAEKRSDVLLLPLRNREGQSPQPWLDHKKQDHQGEGKPEDETVDQQFLGQGHPNPLGRLEAPGKLWGGQCRTNASPGRHTFVTSPLTQYSSSGFSSAPSCSALSRSPAAPVAP